MHIGIIGGGIAGLTAAYRLVRAGHNVTLVESQPQLGGQAGTFAIHGSRLEKYYHHIFTTDHEIIDLLDELDLLPRLRWLDSKVGFFHGGKIYNFVSPGDLLRFEPISIVDRIRLGLIGLYLQRYKDWQKLEGVTAQNWIKRYAGKRNYQVVWGPLLRGKFGERQADVGMVWFWGKIHLRFASRDKGMQQEKLGYLDGSFGLLIDELEKRITQAGGDIQTGTAVTRIMVDQQRVKGLMVRPSNIAGPPGRTTFLPFDAVVATIPSPEFLSLVPELDGEYAGKLSQARYQAAMCLVLSMRQAMSPIYWMNISDPNIPFVGAIEHTNFVDPSYYGGSHILYLSNYLSSRHPLYQMDCDELLTTYLPHLKKINPAFSPDWIEDCRLFKSDAGQPIITTYYTNRIPDHRTPIDGLYLANTTQIYPEDRGMNYSVRLGNTINRLLG